MKKDIQMTRNNLLRAAAFALVASAAIATLAGCSNAPISPTRLVALEAVLASCPPNTDAAVDVRDDESGSRRTAALVGENRKAVLDALTRAAVCGHGVGRFRLDLFSASIASATNVVDADLALPGSTDIARLRDVPAMVERVTKMIDDSFASAANSLTEGGTDLPAQLFAAQQFIAQTRANTQQGEPPYQLDLVMLTDGESNAGQSYVPLSATVAAATAQAKATSVPNLKGASILVAGVGDTVSGLLPSSAYVAALTAYLHELGKRTGAAKVTVVTDYTSSGR
jgi:hypothetical protein